MLAGVFKAYILQIWDQCFAPSCPVSLSTGLWPITETYECITPMWANYNAAVASSPNKNLLSLKSAPTILWWTVVGQGRCLSDTLLPEFDLEVTLMSWGLTAVQRGRIYPTIPLATLWGFWGLSKSLKNILHQLETFHWDDGSSSQKAMRGWRRHSLTYKACPKIFLFKGCSTEGVQLSWTCS